MVTIIAKWKVKAGYVDTVLKLAKPLIDSSRQEPGNLKYDLYIKHGTNDEILLHEIYTSMADFELHKTMPYFNDIAVEQIIPLLAQRELSVFEE